MSEYKLFKYKLYSDSNVTLVFLKGNDIFEIDISDSEDAASCKLFNFSDTDLWESYWYEEL